MPSVGCSSIVCMFLLLFSHYMLQLISGYPAWPLQRWWLLLILPPPGPGAVLQEKENYKILPSFTSPASSGIALHPEPSSFNSHHAVEPQPHPTAAGDFHILLLIKITDVLKLLFKLLSNVLALLDVMSTMDFLTALKICLRDRKPND